MSPILVRPFREQFEHDRIIRVLQARWRRRYDVGINVGDAQTVPVRIGANLFYPDLVLNSPRRGHRLEAVVEVETTESVNNLEAMAQWAHLGRVRGAFYLYVPAGSAEIARRLCSDNQVAVGEIWSYHMVGDQTRFTLIHELPAERPGGRRASVRRKRAAAATRKPTARPAPKRRRRKVPASSRAARSRKRR